MSRKNQIQISILLLLSVSLSIFVFFQLKSEDDINEPEVEISEESNSEVFTDAEIEQNQQTTDEISTFNGLDGNDCRIIVQGNTYQIDQDQTPFWNNGVHTSSRGQVSCGMDATKQILGSPHGNSVLSDSAVSKVSN